MAGKVTITEDIEQILGQLSSDEARAKVICGLVLRKVVVPKNHLEGAIAFYEKAGRFGEAAGVAQNGGLTERALDNYERVGMFEGAAYIAKNAGLTERASQLYIKAIDACEKAGEFNDAARIAQKVGLTEKVRLYKTLEKLLYGLY